MTSPFDDLPVIGALSPEAAAAKLRELGEPGAAEALDEAASAPPAKFATRGAGAADRSAGASDRGGEADRSGGGGRWPFRDRTWQHTAHAFGFLPAAATSSDILPIDAVAADPSLKHARLKIALNRLRVADYPGRGTHRILLDFYARNQVPGPCEDLHFNATYRVREGQRAPIAGYPIFLGLNVGGEGVSFRCHTVNVKNDSDEALLDLLETDVFRSGLKLATTAQPALAPLSGLALGLTRAVAQRNRNVSVQDFYLGLDFAGTRMGARLAIGDYLAVQIPEQLQTVWRWSDWVYDPQSGMVVARADPARPLPYNYLVFGVSRYEE